MGAERRVQRGGRRRWRQLQGSSDRLTSRSGGLWRRGCWCRALSGLGVNQVEDRKGHSKRWGQRGQESDETEERSKCLGSEWPRVAGVGVVLGDKPG